ncbi:MAG: hypothetical protein IPM71_07655 [Bacteroidota bacterium]|nr:MAG: hypothetical protein IPM71_07655 [Bacteroidota bacterium]
MKSWLIYLMAVLLLAFYNGTGLAQFYSTGTAPSTVKWKSIQTPQFRLIYPAETEQMAQKYASTLRQVYPFTGYSLAHKPKKLDIVLYNQSVISNGFVVWAPKRMELITTSPQNTYAHNWLEQLALHEHRHVVQIDKLNQGFTKVLSLFGGQMVAGAMSGFLPLWYLEGDAVVTETALSNTGRGRDPEFIQQVMAAETQLGKKIRYDEFYLGTYKAYAPDYYHYGYFMTAWSRKQYPDGLWPKIIDQVARKPFLIAPLHFKLKKETGLSKLDLYRESTQTLANEWLKENELRGNHSEHKLAFPTSYSSRFTSYKFPYQTSKGSLIAVRTSIDDIARLVEIDPDGKEKILYTLGSFRGSTIACSPNYIAWEEIQYDTRWEQKNYSVIRIYNQNNGKTHVLKSKERHFSPTISRDETTIGVIKDDGINHNYLEIYDISTGKLIKRYLKDQETYLSYPVWLDSHKIAVVVLTSEGKGIAQLDTQTGLWKDLMAPAYYNIEALAAAGNALVFTYSYDGRSNIYSLDTATSEISRLTDEKIGANYASFGNGTGQLLYSEYTAGGYQPRALKPNLIWEPINAIIAYTYSLADTMAAQEKINIQDTLLPLQQFSSKPYPKGLHLFNLHSWILPFYINLTDLPDEELRILPGITLFSQNSLSNLTSSISYYIQDGYHYLQPRFSFQMFYPVISFESTLGGPPNVLTNSASITNLPESIHNHVEWLTEISVPLNFSTSRYNLGLIPAVKHRYENLYVADSSNYGNAWLTSEEIYYYKGYSSFDYRANFYASTKMAYKSLYPRWAFYYFVSHLTPAIQKQYWGKSTVNLATVYLPGLFRHHSLQFQFGLENGFGKRMALPRGYAVFNGRYDKAFKINAGYGFQVAYPDLSIGPLVYIKRVQALVYYDRFQYENTRNQKLGTLSSVGMDLGFETHFLRFYWNFLPSLRLSYLIESQSTSFDFYISTRYSFALGGNQEESRLF